MVHFMSCVLPHDKQSSKKVVMLGEGAGGSGGRGAVCRPRGTARRGEAGRSPRGEGHREPPVAVAVARAVPALPVRVPFSWSCTADLSVPGSEAILFRQGTWLGAREAAAGGSSLRRLVSKARLQRHASRRPFRLPPCLAGAQHTGAGLQ